MEYLTNKSTDFASDVLKGLGAKDKFLLSKYFYDKAGDKLFQRIMKLPEYYLTRMEFDILKNYKAQILQQVLKAHQPINVVELGVGDGLKTKILIDFLYKNDVDFQYIPIDISGNVLDELVDGLDQEFPGLKVLPIKSTYKNALEEKVWRSGKADLNAFLGGQFGEFCPGRST